MPAEPTLLQAPAEEAKHDKPEISIAPLLRAHARMHGSDISSGPPDRLGDGAEILPRQNQCDLSRLLIQNFADIGEAAVLADSVESVLDFAAGCLDYGLELLDELRLALAVVDDDVALLAGDERFDKGNAAAGDADQGVDIGELGELNGVGADGRSGAVDDERCGCCCGVPGEGEALEALIQAEGGGHGC